MGALNPGTLLLDPNKKKFKIFVVVVGPGDGGEKQLNHLIIKGNLAIPAVDALRAGHVGLVRRSP